MNAATAHTHKLRPLTAAGIAIGAIVFSVGTASAQIDLGETAGAYWSFNQDFNVTSENLIGTPLLTMATDSSNAPTISGDNVVTSSFTAFDGTSYAAGNNLRYTGSATATTNTFTLQLNLSNGSGSAIQAEALHFHHRISSTATPLSNTAYKLEYNIGSGWVDTAKSNLDFGTTASTWFSKTITLSDITAIHGQEDVQLRFTFPGYDTTGTSQNIRLDNIQFTGTAVIPEPGTYAILAGFAALALVVTRRRRLA